MRSLTLAAVGCICLLDYVKSQWPEYEHESSIPAGRIQKHPFMGTQIQYIQSSNSIFIPCLSVDADGQWHGNRE
jgi:hypothetical protein